jgi:hydroxymethylpyrimidine pyrophosphatase-like HAD family hydrolase
VKVIVSDFDNTLFKRNHGLLQSTVDYIKSMALPVYIVTYRNEDQLDFIVDTIGGSFPLVGVAFAESPKIQDPVKKINLIKEIMKTHEVVTVIDDDERVLRGLQ